MKAALSAAMSKCTVIRHSPLGFFRTDENNDTDKYSNKHNNFTNPNWREADHLAVYRRSREVELGVTENNSRRSEWDLNMLNPRPTDFKSDAPTTRPRYFPDKHRVDMGKDAGNAKQKSVNYV